RLTAGWEAKYHAWRQRDLHDVDYVYVWIPAARVDPRGSGGCRNGAGSHQTKPGRAPSGGDRVSPAPTPTACARRRTRSASRPATDTASGWGSAPSPFGSTRTSQVVLCEEG